MANGLTLGTIFSGQTTTGASSTYSFVKSGRKSFQAAVTGTGTVTATVVVQVSNDVTNLGWLTLGTITLSGTTTATDGFVSEGSWNNVRGNITALTGTAAAVTLICAQE